jgi:hypothetical protein
MTEALPPDARVTVLLLRLVVGGRCVVGALLVERLMVPLNPFRLLSVIVEVIPVPREMVRLVGLAAIAKFAVVKTAV